MIQKKFQEKARLICQLLEVLAKDQGSPEELDGILLEVFSCTSESCTRIFEITLKKCLKEG